MFSIDFVIWYCLYQENASALDTHLFVGDVAGLKKAKAEAKKIDSSTSGKHYIYITGLLLLSNTYNSLKCDLLILKLFFRVNENRLFYEVIFDALFRVEEQTVARNEGRRKPRYCTWLLRWHINHFFHIRDYY